MARKKKAPPKGASKAYLISFGDTMTALLAFFITLNSLAKEQTGADLHAGTGSFVTALDSFGMPGQFSKNTSQRPIQMNELNTSYLVEGDAEGDNFGNGPDTEDNGIPSQNAEHERLQRFLAEMDRVQRVDDEPEDHGEIVFDIFEKLGKQSPYLPSAARRIFAQVLPLLDRPSYEVTLVVWATTPGRSAWNRAVEQSQLLVDEFAKQASLVGADRARLHPEGRPWGFKDAKRPVMSVIVTRKYPRAK